MFMLEITGNGGAILTDVETGEQLAGEYLPEYRDSRGYSGFAVRIGSRYVKAGEIQYTEPAELAE